MPRHKALAALAFFGVLISAGSVGSQDPFLARSEAESAESATPITVQGNQFAPSYDASEPYKPPSEIAPPPVAVGVPLSITPDGQAIAPAPTAPATATPAPIAAAPAEAPSFELALASTASRASAATVPVTPTPQTVIAPAAQTVLASLPADRLVAGASTQFAQAEDETAPRFGTAERRLLATVPDEIEGYFDLFMYVSKSNRGPLAQRMFVFQRDVDGKLIPYAEWRVSTGREKIELHRERKVRTTTPEGIFALDPDRFYRRYWSKTWDGAPMPYAMFYDLQNNGNHSGLAIHAAMGKDKIRRLGRRDSAGCVRLAPKNAKELFYKIRSTTQGRVPAFAMNERGSTDRWGRVQHDETGAMMLQDGYRAVLFVENYDGRDEILGPVIAYTH